MDFKALVNSIFTLPQTQRDVSQIAEAARQAQSPQMQAQISQMRSDLTAAIGAQMFMQVVSTAALVGIAVMLYKRRR